MCSADRSVQEAKLSQVPQIPGTVGGTGSGFTWTGTGSREGSNSCSPQKVSSVAESPCNTRSPLCAQRPMVPTEGPGRRFAKQRCMVFQPPFPRGVPTDRTWHPTRDRHDRKALSLLRNANDRQDRRSPCHRKGRGSNPGRNSPPGTECTGAISVFPAVFSGRSPKSQRPWSCSARYFPAPGGCIGAPLRRVFATRRRRAAPGYSSS